MTSPTLTFLGHATFAITASCGARLLIDPYASGSLRGAIAYPPITLEAGAVVCSHDHVDHAAVDEVPGAPLVLDGAVMRWGPFTIWRHAVAHDEYGGRRRGGMVDMLEVEVEGWRLLHGADVGQSPTAALVDAMTARGPLDVAILPTGGFYTIGAAQALEWWQRLGARWLIPAHFKTSWCHLPMRDVEVFASFLGEAGWFARHGGASVALHELSGAPVVALQVLADAAR